MQILVFDAKIKTTKVLSNKIETTQSEKIFFYRKLVYWP